MAPPARRNGRQEWQCRHCGARRAHRRQRRSRWRGRNRGRQRRSGRNERCDRRGGLGRTWRRGSRQWRRDRGNRRHRGGNDRYRRNQRCYGRRDRYDGTDGVVAVNEIEPNDTAATANSFTPIAVNGRVRAAIGSPGDVDYFAIFVPLGIKAIYITTFSEGVDTLSCAGADTNATLFLPDGVTQIKPSTTCRPRSSAHTLLCSRRRQDAVRPRRRQQPVVDIRVVLGDRFEDADRGVPRNRTRTVALPSATRHEHRRGQRFLDRQRERSVHGRHCHQRRVQPRRGSGRLRDPQTLRLQSRRGQPGHPLTGIWGVRRQPRHADRIRDASGTALVFDDDAGTSGRCSFLSYVIPPATTVYANGHHLDDTAQQSYNLHVSFP